MTPGQPSPARARVAGWIWGLCVCLAVALVLGGAYLGHHYVQAHQQAAAHVTPPAIPPAAVVRAIRPEAGAVFAAPVGPTTVGASTRMVLLAASRERDCPPVGACGPMPPLDRIEVVDLASGDVLAARALDGPARQAVALASDEQRGLVALVAPGAVVTYAADTLAPVGVQPLPDGMVAEPTSGAAVSADGSLWLMARQSGQLVLLGMDERSGQSRAEVPLVGAAAADGPLYDAQTGDVLALARGSGDEGAQVLAVSAAGGGATRRIGVPAGTRLGPLDDATGTLYLYGADGTTYRLNVAGGAGEAPSAVPALFGARMLGWDGAGNVQAVADEAGLRILDAGSGATRAALPVGVQSPPDQALAAAQVGGERDLAVLAEHGTVLVIRPAAGVTQDTAVLLARAALVQLVPQDAGNPAPQDPRFLTPDVFTPGPGERAAVPFMVRDPDVGWQSAAPGTAGVAAAAGPGGAWDITFSVTWTQHHFTHRHVTVLRVAPSGGVTLVSDTGDGLP